MATEFNGMKMPSVAELKKKIANDIPFGGGMTRRASESHGATTTPPFVKPRRQSVIPTHATRPNPDLLAKRRPLTPPLPYRPKDDSTSHHRPHLPPKPRALTVGGDPIPYRAVHGDPPQIFVDSSRIDDSGDDSPPPLPPRRHTLEKPSLTKQISYENFPCDVKERCVNFEEQFQSYFAPLEELPTPPIFERCAKAYTTTTTTNPNPLNDGRTAVNRQSRNEVTEYEIPLQQEATIHKTEHIDDDHVYEELQYYGRPDDEVSPAEELLDARKIPDMLEEDEDMYSYDTTANILKELDVLPPLSKDKIDHNPPVNLLTIEFHEWLLRPMPQFALSMGISRDKLSYAFEQRRVTHEGKDFSTQEDLVNAVFDNVEHMEIAPKPVLENRRIDLCRQRAMRCRAVRYSIQIKQDTLSPDDKDEEVTSIRRNENKQQLQEGRLCCKICMDADVDTLFMPCGHLACCANCANQLKTCPICNATIEDKLKAFIS